MSLLKAPIIHLALVLAGMMVFSQTHAQVPDLTLPEVIQKIDRKNSTYNLGPTGLRGYIHVSRRPNDGPDGTMTGESRQILVTVASAPAAKVAKVDDVILGVAWGRSSFPIPKFDTDARKAFGNAITEAEKKENDGILRLKLWRAGSVKDVFIRMPVMGTYADTAPYTCEKSTAILENARKHFVGKLLANPRFLSQGHPWCHPSHALALLSAVRPEDPDYAAVQTAIQSFARSIAKPTFEPNDGCMWTIGQEGIFLAEYYLATADAEVVPGLQAYIDKLANSMSMYGTCNHRPALLRTDGSDRKSVRGYGTVNNAAIPANLAIVMLKKALITAKQPIAPEVDTAIQRGTDFFAWFVNKGGIPYGEHTPSAENHSSNGKNACAAVFFSQVEDRLKETEYYTRMSVAAFHSREYGHTGQGLGYQWEGMGANVGGPAAAAAYLKPLRWHLDLSRRSDGSFAYDGQEQYGGGSTSDGTYLGKSSYYDLEATAIYLLTHSLPYKRLLITGKNANPAHQLTAEKVANAIVAGHHRTSRSSYSVPQLLKHLGEYDPVVRRSAAVELSTRTLNESELATLRAMLSSQDPNARRSACEALSLLKDASSIPQMTRLLDKIIETDPWVRAAAATALRNYGDMAKSEVPAMLAAFAKNAADPDKIDWAEPTQASNGELAYSLFEPQPGTNYFTFKDAVTNAEKDLRIAAVSASMQHPDSAVRSTAAGFVFRKLSKEDLLMVPNELTNLVLNDTQCDRMWSDPGRQAGVRTLSKHKFFELLPVGSKMSVRTQEFWHEETSLSAILEIANYGDAARWTLPTLRKSLDHWDPKSKQHKALLETIAKVEAATTAPEIIRLKAVANKQVVTTAADTPLKITLAGKSPREPSVTFINLTKPSHGTLTGTAPDLIYTPSSGYSGPDQFSFEVKDALTTSEPTTIGIVVGAAGNGLKGEYFADTAFKIPKLTRTDNEIDFDWGNSSPHESISAGTFSVRWTGYILIPETAEYTFSALGNGVFLQIDHHEIIDKLVAQPQQWMDAKPIPLKKGMKLLIEMAYLQSPGSAAAKLKWTGPAVAGITGDIVPQAYLYDGGHSEP